VPIQTFIDPANEMVITRCFAAVTFAEIVAAGKILQNNPEFHPGFRRLNDLLEVSRADLQFKDLHSIRQSFDPFSNQVRVRRHLYLW